MRSVHRPQSIIAKTAIVTGGTRGVGRALAFALAAKGIRVGLCARSDEEARATAAAVGPGGFGRRVDVANAADVAAFIDEVERHFGPLDILVNNAAIMPVGRLEEEPDETTQRILDVNLAAVIFSMKEAARRMKARGSGHIVNVVSAAGWVAGGGAATYCASKFGVVGYSEAAALELASAGVHVSVVAPGVVATELSAGVQEMRGLRTVTPEEVAGTVIDVLEYPRFAAYVPKRIGLLTKTSAVLPYRLRHGLLHLTKTGTAVLESDMRARQEYEARAVEKALWELAEPLPTQTTNPETD
jgi:NAD(P)-dependent dehydrogenase (short-subunit alcohol dehydrogenase family)